MGAATLRWILFAVGAALGCRGQAPDPHGLEALRAAYSNEVARMEAAIEADRKAKLEALRQRHLGQLDQAAIRLGRLKNVEGAKAVQAEAARLRAEAAGPPSAASVGPPRRPSAPGKPTRGAGANRVLASFEQTKEVEAWESRQGGAIRRMESHATDGEYSLEVPAGALIVTESLDGDWSEHRFFAFDVHLAGKGRSKLEIVIGDQAWLDKQAYWNRHNRWEEIQPGANTVRIALDDLYRGEPGKKGADLKGDLDRKKVRFLSIGAGESGPLYFDAFRLEP